MNKSYIEVFALFFNCCAFSQKIEEEEKERNTQKRLEDEKVEEKEEDTIKEDLILKLQQGKESKERKIEAPRLLFAVRFTETFSYFFLVVHNPNNKQLILSAVLKIALCCVYSPLCEKRN